MNAQRERIDKLQEFLCGIDEASSDTVTYAEAKLYVIDDVLVAWSEWAQECE